MPYALIFYDLQLILALMGRLPPPHAPPRPRSALELGGTAGEQALRCPPDGGANAPSVPAGGGGPRAGEDGPGDGHDAAPAGLPLGPPHRAWPANALWRRCQAHEAGV